MKHTIKNIDESQLELVVTVNPDEYEEQLKQTAQNISQRTNIRGFRKGKAPYERVKNEVGEMKLLQEALELIIQKTLIKVVGEEKLETVGAPEINVEKVAPGNDLIYKATLFLLPKISLPDLSSIKVEKKTKTIDQKEVNKTLETIRKMHATETHKEGTATKEDKVVIDMGMFIDKVPVDGGASRDHQVYLNEDHYIPGFSEQLLGVKKGDKKTFSLEFPKEHYQKTLAGKLVDFDLTVKDVFKRELPEANDELAKKIGQKSLSDLKVLIEKNMTSEAEQKAEQSYEIEILEKLIEKCGATKIPQIIIDSEKQKMFYELKSDLERNGVGLDKYLEDIKKTEKELFEDFQKQAEKRAKAALISRQVAVENNIKVSEEDINNEIKLISEAYKENVEALENLKRQEVKDSIATTIQNKKVMELLKKKITNPSPKENVTKKNNN
jgi:trigger factor